MRKAASLAAAALAAGLLLPRMAAANESLTLVLNWVPTADHSPYYYARQQGLYAKAGIDLAIETGKGSGITSQRVGAGTADIGIADLATALVARSKGADLVAVMNVYANSAQGFYWLKSSGIAGPKDFPGHKIGNPPGDAARVMWPAFAKAVGIDPDSVTWVNIAPQAKIPSLKSHAVDVISDFYNEHDLKLREFGEDLGFLAWRDIGVNPYGNSVIVNGDFLRRHRAVVKSFVEVSQRAFAACVAAVDPCLKALFAEVSGLDERVQHDQWNRIKELMRDPYTTTIALGWLDAKRMQGDYDLVKTYFGLEKPFDVEEAFTDAFLDTSIKMSTP
ncbi:MAG TPA: ABC transporter substrate-binding protein [Stellaceae bacterium]|nr:ABC transporter substrate-binding protein [Stellaceae bacterium]